MTTAVKLSRKTTNKNEGEGTVAKVRESQSAMKSVEEMSTDANASRRSLPVAQIIEKNAEEDLANLFAPMAPKSKKTKAKKKLLSSGLGGEGFFGDGGTGGEERNSGDDEFVVVEEIERSDAKSDEKIRVPSVRGLLLHGVPRVRTDAG